MFRMSNLKSTKSGGETDPIQAKEYGIRETDWTQAKEYGFGEWGWLVLIINGWHFRGIKA